LRCLVSGTGAHQAGLVQLSHLLWVRNLLVYRELLLVRLLQPHLWAPKHSETVSRLKCLDLDVALSLNCSRMVPQDRAQPEVFQHLKHLVWPLASSK
jgi:hypothetical protein